jgi:hypothetical protein
VYEKTEENQLVYEAIHVDGRVCGYEKRWHPNGILSSCEYKYHDTSHGWSKSYDEQGNLIYESEYEFGFRLKSTRLDKEGKTLVRALAVASEPYIFWRGENVEEIVTGISIPPELGCLKPAASNLNGHSGIVLDSHFLNPLGHGRNDAWLCDLVPHSCVNDGQAKAIQREYEPLIQEHNLTRPTVPQVPTCLADDARQLSILNELLQ